MKKDKITAITNVDNFNSSKGAIFLYYRNVLQTSYNINNKIYYTPTTEKPLSTWVTSPVIALDILLNKNVQQSPTSFAVTFLCNGDFSSTISKIVPKSFIPFAESVFIGPAEIAFIRVPLLPKS